MILGLGVGIWGFFIEMNKTKHQNETKQTKTYVFVLLKTEIATCKKEAATNEKGLSQQLPYRGTSSISKRRPIGPYSKTIPRLLWRS